MSITGNPTQIVSLSKKAMAIERAMGTDVKTLSSKYGLSPAQMTQALEEMGFIKKRSDSVEKEKKDSKLGMVMTKYNLSQDTIIGIITDMGLKVPAERSSRKYIIVDDLGEVNKVHSVQDIATETVVEQVVEMEA